jgi:hypothetical protein
MALLKVNPKKHIEFIRQGNLKVGYHAFESFNNIRLQG